MEERIKALIDSWNDYNKLYSNVKEPLYEFKIMYLLTIREQIEWFVENNCLNDLLNHIKSLKEDECVRVEDYIDFINKSVKTFPRKGCNV